MTEHVHPRHVLSEYFEGELLLSERQTVERHLKVCAVCRQELCVLRRTVDALQRLPREITPSDFMDKLRSRVEQHEVKSQRVAGPVSGALSRAALVRQVLELRRLLFFPLPARLPISLGIVVLGLATVLSRTSSEPPTTTQVLPTVSAPSHWEALPQKMASVTDEKIQAVPTVESAPEQTPSSSTPQLSPTKTLNVGSALVWRVTGSEPLILRQQVKALVSQSAEAIVIQEEENLLVISLPTVRLPALRRELNTLGTVNFPDAEIGPNTPTTVVHIEFIRSSSVVAPPHPAQLSGRS